MQTLFEGCTSRLEGRIREDDQFGGYNHLKGMDMEGEISITSECIKDEEGRLLRGASLFRELVYDPIAKHKTTPGYDDDATKPPPGTKIAETFRPPINRDASRGLRQRHLRAVVQRIRTRQALPMPISLSHSVERYLRHGGGKGEVRAWSTSTTRHRQSPARIRAGRPHTLLVHRCTGWFGWFA